VSRQTTARAMPQRPKWRPTVALFEGLLDAAPDAMLGVHEDGFIAFANRQAEVLFGYDRSELLGLAIEVLVPVGARGVHPRHRDTYFSNPQVRPMGAGLELAGRRKDGSEFPAEISLSSITTEQGLLVTAAVRDVTERTRTDQQRTMQFAVSRALSECRTLDEAASRVLESMAETLGWHVGGIWLVEPATAVLRLRYWHTSTLEGKAFESVSRALVLTRGQGLPGRAWTTGAPVTLSDLTADAHCPRADAARALNLHGQLGFPILGDERVLGVVEFLSHQIGAVDDMTLDFMADIGRQIGQFLERRRAEAALEESVARLAEIAASDPLTGLRNRREFERLLVAVPHRRFAVLAINVDNLKQVNDEFGHEAGDVVLRAVAQLLLSLLRGWDIVARIGGDEFAVVLLEDATGSDAATAGEQIRAAVSALSVPYGQARISVGWAAGEAGGDAMTVWCRADDELFRAKRSGKDRVVGGDVDCPAPHVDRSAWAQRVERALGERRLGIVYQPIVRLADGAVIGHEALARPEGCGPSDSVDEFFAVAQKIGRIRDVDWLCRRMAVAVVSWPGPQAWALFINVSAMTLMDPVHDVDQMLLVLGAAGASPTQVVLEITEREIISDLARLRLVLATYREHGFRFAVDDVGEGHSTLELLVAACPEILKIARSLTMTASRSGSRSAIRAVTAFAESSGATVLAEGIENDVVAAQMADLGITLGQGWWLGRPAAFPVFEGATSLSTLPTVPDSGLATGHHRLGGLEETAGPSPLYYGYGVPESWDHLPSGRSISVKSDRWGEAEGGLSEPSVAEERDQAGEQRDQAGERRDQAAAHRDQAAEQRDQAAAHRDDAAEQSEALVSAGMTTDVLDHSVVARRDAASDRRQAAQDRRAAATERTQADLDRDTALADRGASAREREYAALDDLTGVYLRAAGFVELEREMARARRREQPLVLAFVDVDHLKAINDSRGHAAGDRMLLEVANTLRATLRSYDLIIRYGGDEFVCVISGLNMADATNRLALVNAALAEAPEHGSVTVGLAKLRADDSPEDFVARADAALYRERHQQRHTCA
jgi:diguanylate cyclase (GGDEF)-like protein/PAS domain S-box-containing protein